KTICPVCESNIPHDEKKCPVCGADLRLFDEDIDLDEDSAQESIEKVMDMVMDEEGGELIEEIDEIPVEEEYSEEDMEDEDINEELIEGVKNLGLSEEDLGKEEDHAEKEDTEELITFECPVCESEVGEDDAECPNCGVIFEVEERDKYKEEAEGKKDEEKRGVESDFAEIEDSLSLEIEDIKALQTLPERLSSAEDRIETFGYPNIDLEDIERNLQRAKDLFEEEKGTKAEDLIEKVEESMDHAEKVGEKVERCQNYIEWVSNNADTSELEGWVEEIHRGCEIGEYKIASKKAEEVEEDIKEVALDTGLKDEDTLETFVEEKKSVGEENLSNINDLDVDLDINTEHIKERMKKASEEKESGNMIDRFHEVMYAVKRTNKLYEFTSKIQKAEDHLEELEKNDFECSDYSEKIDEAKQKAQEGEWDEAIEVLEKTVKDIEEVLDEKKSIEEEEKKDLFKKIQKKIPQMKGLLETAKDFGVEIEEGKDLINEAVQKTKDNEYENALDSLNDCETFFQKKLDDRIDTEIEELAAQASEDEVESLIEDIRSHKSENDYEKVYNLIDAAEQKIEEEEESLEEVKIYISDVEKMMTEAEKFDFEFPKARKLIEKAKERYQQGNPRRCTELLDDAEDKVFQRLPNILKKEIKDAKEDLKKAKIKGANISEPVKLLKEINLAMKQDDLEKSFEKLKKYKEKMEEISREL
ncbi:MAG: hypothetical protein ACOCTR_04620, partial [Candidatus Natronoplasma sp.]